MNKKYIVISVLTISLLAGFGFWALFPSNSSQECSAEPCSSESQSNPEVALAKQASLAAGQQQAYLLDVRTVEEYAVSNATNSQNFDVEKLIAGTMPNIPKDSTIYVYCRSGNRSEQAKNILEKNGFSNVTDLGGLQNMKDAGVL